MVNYINKEVNGPWKVSEGRREREKEESKGMKSEVVREGRGCPLLDKLSSESHLLLFFNNETIHFG